MRHLLSFNEAGKVPEFAPIRVIAGKNKTSDHVRAVRHAKRNADARARYELSTSLDRSIKYQALLDEMKDLKNELAQTFSDQENDPDVLANTDNDNPAVREYGDRIEKLEDQIEKLDKKMRRMRHE